MAVQMATEIRSFAALTQLQHIRGVDIPTIETKARADGSLGGTESFRGVLQNDWRPVQALGVIHIELAGHLRQIMQLAHRDCQRTWGSFSYSVESLPGAILRNSDVSWKGSDTWWRTVSFVAAIALPAIGYYFRVQSIQMIALILLGAIGCIAYAFRARAEQFPNHQTFAAKYDAVRGAEEENIFDGEGVRECWSTSELHLSNSLNGETLVITDRTIAYIEKYGFYRAGKYRVDPIKLISLLTGNSVSRLQEQVRRAQNG